MLEIIENNKGWIIETTDARVLTAIYRGLKERIEDAEYLLEKGHISNVEYAKIEIGELKELLKKLH